MKIKYYTDGACNNETKRGAWGCICVVNTFTETKEILRQTATITETTSNRMELYAGYVALTKAYNMAKKNSLFEERLSAIEIYSDSIYLINGINRNWLEQWQKNNYKNRKGETVKNLDLWEQIMRKVESIKKTNVELVMIKCDGHNGFPYNEEIDRLVKEELKNETA